LRVRLLSRTGGGGNNTRMMINNNITIYMIHSHIGIILYCYIGIGRYIYGDRTRYYIVIRCSSSNADSCVTHLPQSIIIYVLTHVDDQMDRFYTSVQPHPPNRLPRSPPPLMSQFRSRPQYIPICYTILYTPRIAHIMFCTNSKTSKYRTPLGRWNFVRCSEVI